MFGEIVYSGPRSNSKVQSTLKMHRFSLVFTLRARSEKFLNSSCQPMLIFRQFWGMVFSLMVFLATFQFICDIFEASNQDNNNSFDFYCDGDIIIF